jgi:pantetheine-phosphate adenylyltransferase
VTHIAVYAGTFDPITRGHLSVIERSAEIFQRSVVLIAINPGKTPLFSLDERLDFVRDATRHLSSVEAASTAGLVVDFARSVGARFLVRGIRGASDADYEAELARQNRELAAEIQSIFLPADRELSAVSSSGLKELARNGQDLSAYCTPLVTRSLGARFPIRKATHV